MDEKKIAEKIIRDKNKYFCWVSRPATMQRVTFLVKAFYYWMDTNTVGLHGQGNNFGYYFEKEKYEAAGRRLMKRLNSQQAILKHFSDYKDYSRKLLAVGLKAKRATTSKKELLNIAKEYNTAMRGFTYYLISPFWADEYLFPGLADKLKKIISPEKYADALEIISSPTMLFGYQKYNIALAKAKTIKDYAAIANKYHWIPEYSFQEKLLDVKMAMADRRGLSKGGLLKASLGTPALVKRNQRRLKALLLSLKDKRVREKAKLVNDYINLKTDRIEIYKCFQTNFRNYFKNILELVKKDQPDIKYEDIISLTDEELSDYLRYGHKINIAVARKRFKLDFVSFSVKGDMTFIYNHSLIEKVRKTFLSVESVKEIKGVVVSKGKITGCVRLVLDKNSLNSIKSGEILVANFTSPDYVPAMKKSAGIVTDDGGITSHAAIISRELNKPCVTGTKIATKVLHNGDLVEVDANKGIVKIIKKKR